MTTEKGPGRPGPCSPMWDPSDRAVTGPDHDIDL